jgi:hypothetical protein
LSALSGSPIGNTCEDRTMKIIQLMAVTGLGLSACAGTSTQNLASRPDSAMSAHAGGSAPVIGATETMSQVPVAWNTGSELDSANSLPAGFADSSPISPNAHVNQGEMIWNTGSELDSTNSLPRGFGTPTAAAPSVTYAQQPPTALTPQQSAAAPTAIDNSSQE